MPEMTDAQFIGYCDMHCESERALFSGEHINRMLVLAGHPKGFARSVPPGVFISVHEDMKTLCELARARQAAPPARKPGLVIPFPGVDRARPRTGQIGLTTKG